MALAGKVCLVTGATRGIGRGIALQLGEAQATVYITGRTLKRDNDCSDPGSLEETAREVEERGGRCIPVVCDHFKDEEVEELFQRIDKETDGQLDILVNNVFSAVDYIAKNVDAKFWEQPLSAWDNVNHVGLRNHYLCTTLAARMMVPRKQGLIVWVSSPGGLRYVFSVPYGVGKAAVDRMAADCAVELKQHNVSCISLWPCFVKTEKMAQLAEGRKKKGEPQMGQYHDEGAETVEYSGRCIVSLASDKNVLKKSGRIQITVDLGEEYGFTDVDGKIPWHMRRVWVILLGRHHLTSAKYCPAFLKIPKWLFALIGSKF